MKLNIALVEPKAGKSWGKNNQHIGLLRIGRWLKDTGENVEYLCYPALPRFQPDEFYITSLFTYDYKLVFDTVQFYKNLYPNALIRLGGIYATIAPDHARSSGADEVLSGQHPMACSYAPDPSLLPVRPDFAYLFTSLGCNRACTFCAARLIHGDGIKQVEPEQAYEHIALLYGEGFREIFLGDDNLLYNSEGHINRICELVIGSGMQPKFRVPGGMAAKDLTEETAHLMKRAGFKELSFGLESVSADVLTKMGRKNNTTPDDLVRALELTDKEGFDRRRINAFFVIGLPYQTIDDMVATLAFLVELGVWAHPQRLTPIPNTVEWKRMNLEHVDYTDLAYSTFVAPDQDNFTDGDLKAIYAAARQINIGRRVTGGSDWLTDQRSVSRLFRDKLQEHWAQKS